MEYVAHRYARLLTKCEKRGDMIALRLPVLNQPGGAYHLCGTVLGSIPF